jgi:endonuclease/exonuclease/phosphatase family metal-dependent hydrolase
MARFEWQDLNSKERTILELNIISFNIRNMRSKDGDNGWEARRELLCQVLRQHAPDVLGVQEAYLPQVEYLRQMLPEYDTVSAGREDGDTEGEHCTLLFRRDLFRVAEHGTFWFSETPDVPGSRHWTRFHARICTWARLIPANGQALYAYNLHLDHESQIARERSVLLLLDHLRRRQPADPALIMGDFNMGEDNPALAQLAASTSPALQDTFRAVNPDARDVGTFHEFTGSTDGDKIDYIFVTPEFQTLTASILHDNQNGRYPSDHFPILTRVSL